MSQLSIKFGTIAGRFEVQIMDERDRRVLFLQAYPTESIPISWGMEENDQLTETDLEELRTMLEPVTRVFDKKLTEAVAHFMTKRRR